MLVTAVGAEYQTPLMKARTIGTGMRLYEAQRLMQREGLDARSASRRVGYESEAQFSREYKRLFGQTPGRDSSRSLA